MANEPVQPGKLPLALLLLWAVIWALMSGIMFLAAVLGLVCFVVAVISLLVERWSVQMYLGDTQMQTPMQKVWFAFVGAALCMIGIAFWWLRRRGHVVRAVVLYVGVMVLLLVIAWATGTQYSLSIGWAAASPKGGISP